ncbi:MAG TPA: hypothetical protein VGJ54_02705 [Streptosporangiaceae bacterium]
MDAGRPVAYAVALEQQVRLIRTLLSPAGASVVAEDLFGDLGKEVAELGLGRAYVARQTGQALREATPFYWAGHIAHAVREAVRTMPAYTFTAESFPCPWGFAWFDEPVLLVEDEAGPQLLRALHWQVRPAEPNGRAMVGINGYLAAEGSPGLRFAVRAVVYFGETLESVVAAHGDALRVASDTYERRAPGQDRDDVLLRFFAGCLSFLEQRITTSEQRTVSRFLRRQLEREKHPVFRNVPAVRVIELRRRAYREHGHDEPTGNEAPAWQYQWIVSGHWRRQYYPASDAHKPRYIAPYVKGPADRPLKAPAGDVFAVTR